MFFLKVTSYEKDVGYKIHTDCTEGNKDLRDRYATILIYLQDVPEGGETEFTGKKQTLFLRRNKKSMDVQVTFALKLNLF